MRADGYCFVAVPCADGHKRVIAGCRYFTRDEARAHWNEAHPRHAITKPILDYFEAIGEL
jgi:hypothetical protein